MKPALTAEEWAAFLAEPQELRTLLGHAQSEMVTEVDSAGVHGLAALALHGQPFGFTREDVAALRHAALIADNEDAGDGSSEEYQALNSIADRIEALLPPEG